MIKYIKKNQSIIYVVSFIVFSLAVFIPYLNDFHYQNMASQGDFPFVLDARQSFVKNAFVFRPYMNNGYVDTSPWLLSLYSPYLIFLSVFDALKLSPLLITLLFITTAMILSCLSMYNFLNYLLVKKIKLDHDYVKFASFIGSVLYSFTPYFTRMFEPGHFFFLFLSAFFPLVLKYYDLFLVSGKIKITYIYMIFILILLHSFCFANPGYIFIYFLILFLYTILISVIARINMASALFRLFICYAAFILANIWWLLPMVLTMGDVAALNEQSKQTIGAGIYYATQNSNILNIITGRAEAELPISNKLHTVMFENGIALVYFLFLALFYYYLIKEKQNKYYYYSIIVLMLVSVYFIKGPQPPFPQLFMYLYEHVLVFQIFRRPASKIYWFYFFSFASLVAVSVAYFLNATKNNLLRNLTMFLLVGGILFFVAIFGLTKELIPFDVPKHYFDSKKQLTAEKVSKAMVFPDLGGLYPYYNQSLNYLAGLDFIGQVWEFKLYIPNNTAWTLDTPERRKVNELANNIYESKNICSLTQSLNISHIIVKHDLMKDTYRDDLLLAADSNLNKSNEVESTKDYPGSFTIYSIKQQCRSDLFQITSTKIQYERINPTKFRIYVYGLKGPQVLSYLEAFSSHWKLYLSKRATSVTPKSGYESYTGVFVPTDNVKIEFPQTFLEGEELSYLWKKPFSEDTHHIVSEYANGWTIDPEYVKSHIPKDYYNINSDGSMDIELTLYFKPQSYFYAGAGITLSVLVFSLAWIIYSNRSRPIIARLM